MLGTVTVLNKHHYKDKPLPPDALFIGRPSLYGNPFSHMEKTQAKFRVETRDAAVRAYAHWLAKDEEAAPIRESIRALARRVAAGEDLYLVCYCCPLACHGDILKHHILRIAKDIQNEEAEVN